MHGRDKFVFLRFESSESKCKNSMELSSLYMSFGNYLRIKPCNKDIMGLNA